MNKQKVTLWYETFGNPNSPPLLLIMGGGCQGIMWPKIFCEQLSKTFFVIRYDHRDVGLSSRIDFDRHPYDLMDMARDALAILDNCNIQETYILGTSMGGSITQLLSYYFSGRVRAAAIMSSTTDLGCLINAIEGKALQSTLPAPSDKYLEWIKQITNNPIISDNEKVKRHLDGWRLLNGSVLSFEEDTYYDLVVEQCKRQGNSNDGVNNHIRAIRLWLKKKYPQRHIRIPVSIFWGDQDPIFSIEHAEAILDKMPNGKLFIVKGMGHNLNAQVYDFIISRVQSLPALMN